MICQIVFERGHDEGIQINMLSDTVYQKKPFIYGYILYEDEMKMRHICKVNVYV